MASRPTTLRLTRMLLFADSLVLVAFAVLTGAGAHPSFGPMSGYRWPATLLAVLVAALLGGFAVHLRNPTPLGFWLGVSFLAATVLAAFFDQFGLVDLLFVVAMALPLVLLVRDRAWYLNEEMRREGQRGSA